MVSQQFGVDHAAVQGQIHREVSGWSLQALTGGSTSPPRDGQFGVVSRKRRRKEVWMEESLQRGERAAVTQSVSLLLNTSININYILMGRKSGSCKKI